MRIVIGKENWGGVTALIKVIREAIWQRTWNSWTKLAKKWCWYLSIMSLLPDHWLQDHCIKACEYNDNWYTKQLLLGRIQIIGLDFWKNDYVNLQEGNLFIPPIIESLEARNYTGFFNFQKEIHKIKQVRNVFSACWTCDHKELLMNLPQCSQLGSRYLILKYKVSTSVCLKNVS